MHIAYTTTFNANHIHEWSGTPYHMSHALIDNGINVTYIGNLKRQLPPFFKIKQWYKRKICAQRESPRFNIHVAKHYSSQVAQQLKNIKVDAVISPLINPIAYLDTDYPIILWTDAVYSALLGFYSNFCYHSSHTVLQGNEITFQCLSRVKYAIFSSDWAANSAIERYGISPHKVKMIPYGANINDCPSMDHIKFAIQKRASNKIKLLFLAKSWQRKGGDIACRIAEKLYKNGHDVCLTIVGFNPPAQSPPYLNYLGFISKETAAGKAKIAELLSSSHFLILPSRADACPMVFAEASAYGLPSLTTPVGGIATAIKPNRNGMLFGLDVDLDEYCDYIVNTLKNEARYQSLALSARHEYDTRLNWQSSIKVIKELLANASSESHACEI